MDWRAIVDMSMPMLELDYLGAHGSLPARKMKRSSEDDDEIQEEENSAMENEEEDDANGPVFKAPANVNTLAVEAVARIAELRGQIRREKDKDTREGKATALALQEEIDGLVAEAQEDEVNDLRPILDVKSQRDLMVLLARCVRTMKLTSLASITVARFLNREWIMKKKRVPSERLFRTDVKDEKKRPPRSPGRAPGAPLQLLCGHVGSPRRTRSSRGESDVWGVLLYVHEVGG